MISQARFKAWSTDASLNIQNALVARFPIEVLHAWTKPEINDCQNFESDERAIKSEPAQSFNIVADAQSERGDRTSLLETIFWRELIQSALF